MNTHPHPPDDALATLADGDADAALQSHVDGCGTCQQRVAWMQRAAQSLRAPLDSVDDVTRNVMARIVKPPTVSRAWLLTALPAVAAFLWMVRSPVVETPQARGVPVAGAPRLQMSVVQGDAAQVLADGATWSNKALPLRASVATLPASEKRYVAVYARDASGRITWLMPSWTDAAASPACVELERHAHLHAAPDAVEIPALTPGPLDVVLLQSVHPCTIPALDDALEAGTALPDGVQRVDGIQVKIQ